LLKNAFSPHIIKQSHENKRVFITGNK